MNTDEFKSQIKFQKKEYTFFDIHKIETKGIANIKRLPFSIRILVENVLRKLDGHIVREQDLINIARWKQHYDEPIEIPFHPARVLMQDFTGVPAIVDLAAMRDAVKALGGDPKIINPLIPVELVIDHSVQVDYYGTEDSLTKNVKKEYERNIERYALLKWAQKSFNNLRVVPPNSGICHQVNLEYLGRVIITEEIPMTPLLKKADPSMPSLRMGIFSIPSARKEEHSVSKGGHDKFLAYPDTLVGTDSHTTMINGIGIMGWGVGGIEAEAVMLGQPYFMSIPEVVGVRMTGELKAGVTATDLALTVTQLLRKHKVVEKFVEFIGPGMKNLTLTDRATVANMAPEYGATMGFFPVDEKSIEYLKMTNRAGIAEIAEVCTKALGLFYTGTEEPEYTKLLEIDLSTVEPSLAGPARPQDRILLKDLKTTFEEVMGCKHERDADISHISTFHHESGTITTRAESCEPSVARMYGLNLGSQVDFGDGSIVIAAITSCTNTSNPYVLLGAALLAKKAVEKGLKVPPYVKTSIVPGSRIVNRYLEDSGLMPYLKALGFHLAGFGCTTCIGNSGPLHPEIEKIISKNNLTVAAILSGNRNFEARIHQSVKGNFLASPMLVVAFAIAGRIDVDLTTQPLALDPNGEPVYLKDIWPDAEEIKTLICKHVKPEFFKQEYETIFEGDEFWKNLSVKESITFDWAEDSTYIKSPSYFENFRLNLTPQTDIKNARVLLVLGNSVTTDHISPAGSIPKTYPAGQYLIEKQVSPKDFNSYGARRGNHEVMMRGTFGNIRIKNKLVAPKEGSLTVIFPECKEMFVYDAAMKYKDIKTPLLLIGGKEYGTGSSRDWAAKGTTLLGIKAVLVESYERIHRSNLVGMGVLPLVFKEGDSYESLGLDGSETFFINGITDMKPRKVLTVQAIKPDGKEIKFEVIARLNADIEVDYVEHGGILPYVLRKLMKG